LAELESEHQGTQAEREILRKQVAATESELGARTNEATQLQDQLRVAHSALADARQHIEQVDADLAHAKPKAAKVPELEQALASAREHAERLAAELAETKPKADRLPDLEHALAAERERSDMLSRRISEAEHAAEQSAKRLEDMARKLGEIAGLASKLGSGPGR
jgi:chromosome segregation ATPase